MLINITVNVPVRAENTNKYKRINRLINRHALTGDRSYWYLVEVIRGELEDADQVWEISWRSVGEDDDLQTADQQGAMEDVLLQNTLKHTSVTTYPRNWKLQKTERSNLTSESCHQQTASKDVFHKVFQVSESRLLKSASLNIFISCPNI